MPHAFRNRAPRALAASLAVLTLCVVGLAAAFNTQASSDVGPTVAQQHAQSLSAAFRQTAQQLQPSVVAITTEASVAGQSRSALPPEMNDEMLKRFFEGSPFGELFREMPRGQFHRPSAGTVMRRGIGSGVIIDASGIVLTNNHVVAGGDNIMVKLADGRSFQAVEVKTDPKTDLAVLRIDASGLTAARLGDSDSVEIGDWVLALGQPFGLEGSVTAGIISAKGRGIGITARENFLQTDAAINPGNSGGPLVNLNGQVIGINTAISSASGGNDGVGFAVPVNLARWVSDQLIAEGTVQRSYLGVGIQPMTQDLAGQFAADSNRGVLVTQVLPDSPADKAGLQTGDVILRYAGKEVKHPRELQNMVERCQPGSRHVVEVLRNGKQIELTAVCEAQPSEKPSVAGGAPPRVDSLGIQVADLSDDVAEKLGLSSGDGVVITDVAADSLAARAGLRRGAVIVEVNRQTVTSAQQFAELLSEADPEEGILLLVRSANGARYLVLKSR